MCCMSVRAAPSLGAPPATRWPHPLSPGAPPPVGSARAGGGLPRPPPPPAACPAAAPSRGRRSGCCTGGRQAGRQAMGRGVWTGGKHEGWLDLLMQRPAHVSPAAPQACFLRPPPHRSMSCMSAPSMHANVCAAKASNRVAEPSGRPLPDVCRSSPPPLSSLASPLLRAKAAPAAPAAAAASFDLSHGAAPAAASAATPVAASPAAAADSSASSGFRPCFAYTLARSASSAGPYAEMEGRMAAGRQARGVERRRHWGESTAGMQQQPLQLHCLLHTLPRLPPVRSARCVRIPPASPTATQPPTHQAHKRGVKCLPRTRHKRGVKGFVHVAQPRHIPQHVAEGAGIKVPARGQAGVRQRIHAVLACRRPGRGGGGEAHGKGSRHAGGSACLLGALGAQQPARHAKQGLPAWCPERAAAIGQPSASGQPPSGGHAPPTPHPPTPPPRLHTPPAPGKKSSAAKA